MCTDTGPADYVLLIDSKACGIIEAKRKVRNSAALEEFRSVEEVLADAK